MTWNTQQPPSGSVPQPRSAPPGSYGSGPGPYQRPPSQRGITKPITWILIVAGVVVAVVIAALVVPGILGGAGKASPAPSRLAGSGPGTVPGDWQAASIHDNALGSWSYRNSIIVAADTQVTAYDSGSGKVLWQTKAPQENGHQLAFCGASPAVSGSAAILGIGFIEASQSIDCHSVIELNVANGKLGWAAQIPDAAQIRVYAKGNTGLTHQGIAVAISGRHVVAGWLGVVTSFSLASGHRQWSAEVGPDTPHSKAGFTGNVVSDIAASGHNLYLAVAGVLPERLQVVRIAAATGRTRRAVTLHSAATGVAQPNAGTFISTAPLAVVTDDPQANENTSIMFLGPRLNVRRVVKAGPQIGPHAAAGKSLFASDVPGGNVDARRHYPLVVGHGLLIGATIPPSSGGGNPLVAINHRTGRTRWAKAVRGSDILFPVAVAGRAVDVVGVSQGGRGNPVLMKFSLANGKLLSSSKPRSFGAAPMADELGYYDFAAAGGTVYGINWSHTKASDAANGIPDVFTMH